MPNLAWYYICLTKYLFSQCYVYLAKRLFNLIKTSMIGSFIMAVLSVGSQFPEYDLTAVVGGNLSEVCAKKATDCFTRINSKNENKKWRIIFFWPKDFTFVCPTEIAAFGSLNKEFENRNAEIIGISVDNEFVHLNWRLQNQSLANLPFPIASDIKREVSLASGVLNNDGVNDRATFIVDPSNKIQFVSVNSGSVGRNVNEVLRMLDALQSGDLCACSWQKGDPNLKIDELLTESIYQK